MKKSIKVALITFLTLCIIFFSLNGLGIIKIYKNQTRANEPNIKANSYLLLSNFASPKSGDFISYTYEEPFIGSHTRIHRLVAQEGDTLKIINGILYVNSKKADENRELAYTYELSLEEYKALKEPEAVKEKWTTDFIGGIVVRMAIPDKTVKKHKLKAKQAMETEGSPSPAVKAYYKKDWNEDFFGPFVVPKGTVFVLGDNRSNSEDSRHIGPIKTEDIKGVLLF